MTLLATLKAALLRVFGITSTPNENGLVKVLAKRCAEKEQKALQHRKLFSSPKPAVVAKTARLKKGSKHGGKVDSKGDQKAGSTKSATGGKKGRTNSSQKASNRSKKTRKTGPKSKASSNA